MLQFLWSRVPLFAGNLIQMSGAISKRWLRNGTVSDHEVWLIDTNHLCSVFYILYMYDRQLQWVYFWVISHCHIFYIIVECELLCAGIVLLNDKYQYKSNKTISWSYFDFKEYIYDEYKTYVNSSGLIYSGIFSFVGVGGWKEILVS